MARPLAEATASVTPPRGSLHRSSTGPAPLGEGQGRDSETLLGLEARISSTGQVCWDVFVDFFPTKDVEMGLSGAKNPGCFLGDFAMKHLENSGDLSETCG